MRRLCFWVMAIQFAVITYSSQVLSETFLKEGEGRDLVLGTCTACHSESLVLKNHMTRDHWDETITWMQEKQGLWELSPDERKTILDYLATHQGLEETGNAQAFNSSLYRYHYPPNPLVQPD